MTTAPLLPPEGLAIRFQRLASCPDSVEAPSRATPWAAGIDLRSAETTTIPPGGSKPIRTGYAVAIPVGFAGLVRGRSGLAFKSAVHAFHGTIDSDYRGEICVLLWNRSSEALSIRPGDRIAQMLVMPILRAPIEEVESLEPTARGVAGFGSTGIA